MSQAEAENLTLAPFAEHYPSLRLSYLGRTRTVAGLFVKEHWVFSGFTRACPACLAGDGSPVQNVHGGPWARTWRLPVVFGCAEHHSLLINQCPSCQQPVHARSASGLLPAPSIAGLHPAACRATPDPDAAACGCRLDTAEPPAMSDHQAALQHRLDALLHAPASTRSAANHTARYFNDLRITSCLIGASWPVAADIVDDDAERELIDEHIRRLRQTMDATRAAGRIVRELEFYDRPPPDAAVGAAILSLAARLADDPGHNESEIRRMLAGMPRSSQTNVWLERYRRGDHCSPALAQTVTAILRPPTQLTPLPRPASFTTD